MRRSSGKYAKLICDRCSFKLNYTDAVRDWQGFWLHRTPCFEERHPQLDPVKRIDDPQRLDHPRPDPTQENPQPAPDIELIYPGTFEKH